jgi:phosphoserine phosphatase RsbU/P
MPRMIRFSFLAIFLFFFGLAIQSFSPGSIFGILHDIGLAFLILSGAYWFYRGLRLLFRRLLWKVRNKMIVAYLLIGVVPLAILFLIFWLVGTLVFKQLSAVYLEAELREIFLSFERVNHRLILEAYRLPGPVSDERMMEAARSTLERESAGFEGLGLALFRRVNDSRWETIGTISARDWPLESWQAPEWLERSFSGLIRRQNQLFFCTLEVVDGDDAALSVALLLPFDDRVFDYFRRRTSIEMALTRTSPDADAGQFQSLYSSFSAQHGRLSISWAHFFRPIQWETGTELGTEAILLAIPMQTLLSHFFAQAAGPVFGLIVILGAIFFVVESAAILIGIVIARSITSSVDHLYEGARQIEQGRIGFQIPSRNRDQLDAMAEAFNRMSEGLFNLMKEVSEKEWLEKEIEIAREVQRQLFPHRIPEVRGLELAAVCEPARQVSGDYYDFIPLESGAVDIVLGDISGKGISAALLMASMQSALRSRLLHEAQLGSGDMRLSRTAKDVNRHMYRQSSPEAFSTLFLAHYDPLRRSLQYCNAGQHPPLVFRKSQILRLTEGGTVIGLFEDVEYRESTFHLRSGDVALLYTDGVTEAENAQGEMFEEKRLIELIQPNLFLTAQDIQRLVVEEVFAWTRGVEQADDITVVCLKFAAQ